MSTTTLFAYNAVNCLVLFYYIYIALLTMEIVIRFMLIKYNHTKMLFFNIQFINNVNHY